MSRTGLWVIGVLAAVGAVPQARAQEASSAARAEALFQEGRRLMAEGKIGEACPKLAASQELDPGPGTLLNLAACYELNGQSASAWATWLEAAAAAERGGRTGWAGQAKKHAEKLAPTLSRLTILVPTPSNVVGLSVERDGVPIHREEWGEAVPVDPGVHPVVASAPQRQMWSTIVTVGPNAATVTVTVPALVPEQRPSGPAALLPRPVPAADAMHATQPDRGSESGGPSYWKTVGFAMGAAGVVSMAVGGIFGALAKGSHDDAMEQCTNKLCTQEGIDAEDRAHDQAAVSSIAVVSGALVAGSGAALYFLAPAERQGQSGQVSIRAQLLLGGVSVGGVW
jgi:hypothetical protein